MREKRFHYTVTLPPFLTLEKIFDMFRYSGDIVVKILSDEPFSWVMEHTIRYEDDEHLKRSIKFLNYQILGRWNSFGCKISNVKSI